MLKAMYLIGTINAHVGWLSFTLAKSESQAKIRIFFFFFFLILTSALEMRICKIHFA